MEKVNNLKHIKVFSSTNMNVSKERQEGYEIGEKALKECRVIMDALKDK